MSKQQSIPNINNVEQLSYKSNVLLDTGGNLEETSVCVSKWLTVTPTSRMYTPQ